MDRLRGEDEMNMYMEHKWIMKPWTTRKNKDVKSQTIEGLNSATKKTQVWRVLTSSRSNKSYTHYKRCGRRKYSRKEAYKTDGVTRAFVVNKCLNLGCRDWKHRAGLLVVADLEDAGHDRYSSRASLPPNSSFQPDWPWGLSWSIASNSRQSTIRERWKHRAAICHGIAVYCATLMTTAC